MKCILCGFASFHPNPKKRRAQPKTNKIGREPEEFPVENNKTTKSDKHTNLICIEPDSFNYFYCLADKNIK